MTSHTISPPTITTRAVPPAVHLLRTFATLLLAAAAGLARADPPSGCGAAGCGGSGVDQSVLRAALQADGNLHPRHATPSAEQAPDSRADTWARQLGSRSGQEDYNCALSFGIGGSLGKDGFLGTRVLGRTQVWRDGAADGARRPAD